MKVLGLASLVLLFAVAMPARAAEPTSECAQLLDDADRLAADGLLRGSERDPVVIRKYEAALTACKADGVAAALRVRSYLRWASTFPHNGTDAGWAKRAAYYRQAMESVEADEGRDSVALIPLIEALAHTYFVRPTTKSFAEPLYQRALRLRETHYGEQSVEFANGLTYLGYLRVQENRPAEAEQLLRRAVRIAENACGPRCEALVNARTALYDFLKTQPGREAEAAEVEAAALAAIR